MVTDIVMILAAIHILMTKEMIVVMMVKSKGKMSMFKLHICMY